MRKKATATNATKAIPQTWLGARSLGHGRTRFALSHPSHQDVFFLWLKGAPTFVLTALWCNGSTTGFGSV